jgi:hypothetical protein
MLLVSVMSSGQPRDVNTSASCAWASGGPVTVSDTASVVVICILRNPRHSACHGPRPTCPPVGSYGGSRGHLGVTSIAV